MICNNNLTKKSSIILSLAHNYNYTILDGLFIQCLNGTGTRNIGFTVYYAEHFTLQLMGELKWDWELNKWLTKRFCTLPSELMGESMSDPGPV